MTETLNVHAACKIVSARSRFEDGCCLTFPPGVRRSVPSPCHSPCPGTSMLAVFDGRAHHANPPAAGCIVSHHLGPSVLPIGRRGRHDDQVNRNEVWGLSSRPHWPGPILRGQLVDQAPHVCSAGRRGAQQGCELGRWGGSVGDSGRRVAGFFALTGVTAGSSLGGSGEAAAVDSASDSNASTSAIRCVIRLGPHRPPSITAAPVRSRPCHRHSRTPRPTGHRDRGRAGASADTCERFRPVRE